MFWLFKYFTVFYLILKCSIELCWFVFKCSDCWSISLYFTLFWSVLLNYAGLFSSVLTVVVFHCILFWGEILTQTSTLSLQMVKRKSISFERSHFCCSFQVYGDLLTVCVKSELNTPGYTFLPIINTQTEKHTTVNEKELIWNPHCGWIYQGPLGVHFAKTPHTLFRWRS